MSGPVSIHDYLAEFDDIPGTRVYTAARARQGYHLNQFAMSLMKAENRERWKADERAYLDEWKLSDEQKAAVLARDYNRLLDLGGNIYFMAKQYEKALEFLRKAEANGVKVNQTFKKDLESRIGAK